MNSDTLKRVVRAIAHGSQEDLAKLARKIVDDERRTGHIRLAEQLESILDQGLQRPGGHGRPAAEPTRSLGPLPTSRRHGESLASILPHDRLEHHMVLPPATEQRFARIECEYAARERLGAYGLRPRKTVLLYGSPGCGKSLGAKRLAWNTGLPLMKVRFDAILSSYFGESASNLRTVFDAAQQRPCVLLLDECDFIARSRTQTKDIGEASRVVNVLLQLMEEYDAPGLLVATTNVEESLDAAIFRRFDEVFLVPPPGQQEIVKLLRFTLTAVEKDQGIAWDRLADILAGQSAAMTVKAAQDAAKAAVLAGKKIVTEEHLIKAVGDLTKVSGDAGR